MKPLGEAQAKLLQGLHSTGPARWAIRSNVNQHAQMLREVMVAYMMETLAYKLNHDGIEKVKGLVVCPAANLHYWWQAGWQGPVLSSVQFMKRDAPDDTFDVLVVDAQNDYPAKFVDQLDAFLTDPNAPHALLWLPTVTDEQAMIEQAPLMAPLARHRFVTLRID